jgi:hypothetical protein
MIMQINYLEMLINVVLAAFGGLVKRMVEMDGASGKKASVSYYMFGSFISMFVGVIAFLICKNFDVSQLLTAGLTALAGYMGSPLLDTLSDVVKKRIIKHSDE